MKIITLKTYIISFIIISGIAVAGCSDGKQTKETIEGAGQMGHERAMELKTGAPLDTMQIEAVLLDVREREHRLRTRGYDRVADAYIEAFLATLDSVNPSLSQELRQ